MKGLKYRNKEAMRKYRMFGFLFSSWCKNKIFRKHHSNFFRVTLKLYRSLFWTDFRKSVKSLETHQPTLAPDLPIRLP